MRRLLGRADQVVVVDELVAVGDEQVGRGAFHAAADDAAVVLLQLRDQRREVAVAGEQGERVDVLLGVAQVDGIDDHADVGAVLAAHLGLRDVDHSTPWPWNSRTGVFVVPPVAVGPLVDDAAFFQEAFEHQLDLELAGLHVAHADGQVLEIDEYGDQGFVRHS